MLWCFPYIALICENYKNVSYVYLHTSICMRLKHLWRLQDILLIMTLLHFIIITFFVSIFYVLNYIVSLRDGSLCLFVVMASDTQLTHNRSCFNNCERSILKWSFGLCCSICPIANLPSLLWVSNIKLICSFTHTSIYLFIQQKLIETILYANFWPGAVIATMHAMKCSYPHRTSDLVGIENLAKSSMVLLLWHSFSLAIWPAGAWNWHTPPHGSPYIG